MKAETAPGAPSFGRTLFFYYIHVFCYDFIFGYAIFPAYFQLRGTSPEIIGALLAFWAACIILFEIPAGLLADIVDRRWLLVLSPLVKATCFVIWIFAGERTSFYFIGMAFWSLASALRSGTKEATLYEHIAASHQVHRYTAILGRERALQEAATLTGAAMGGFIASRALELAFWASLPPLAVCAVAACFIPDARETKTKGMNISLGLAPGLLRSTWTEYFTKGEVRYVTLYVALCVTLLGTLEDFNQLFLLAIHMPVWSFGIIAATMGIARLTLAYHANSLERFPAVRWAAPLACGFALLISGALPAPYALGAMASAFILIAPLIVLTTSQFQKALDGSSRATTTSVMSAFMETLSVVFNVAIAFLFSQLNVLKTYQICGAYLVVFSIWEFTRRRRSARMARPVATTKKLHTKDVVRNNRVS